MSYEAWLLVLILVTPFLSAMGIFLLRERPRERNGLTAIVSFVPLVLFALLLDSDQGEARFELLEIAPGLAISFALEPLGLVFTGLVAALWPLSMLYSMSYLYANRLSRKSRFFGFFSLAVGATFGVALAGDLLSLLIFYELLTFCTYPLVTHSGTQSARSAGRLYLAMLVGTSILFLLPFIIWLWFQCGTLSFVSGGFVGNCTDIQTANWLVPLFILGVGKAAIMPLHRWLPGAMVAPAPVSALLHAVAVVKAGVFTIAKIFVYVFGLDFLAEMNISWLVYLSGGSAVIAYLITISQDNLKKRLAYSTIGQLSLITMGIALLQTALLGALFNIVTHAVGKITLFFAAGAIQTATGITKVSEMDGVGRAMPVTMTTFAIASFSLIGIPPLGGFFVKLWLLQGALTVENYFALAVLIISPLLGAAFLLPIVQRAFAGTAPKTLSAPPVAMRISLLIPAAALLLIFFFPDTLMQILETVK